MAETGAVCWSIRIAETGIPSGPAPFGLGIVTRQVRQSRRSDSRRSTIVTTGPGDQGSSILIGSGLRCSSGGSAGQFEAEADKCSPLQVCGHLAVPMKSISRRTGRFRRVSGFVFWRAKAIANSSRTWCSMALLSNVTDIILPAQPLRHPSCHFKTDREQALSAGTQDRHRRV